MTLLEQKVKELSELLGLSEEMVEAVARWQWKSIHEAMYHHSSIEVTGLGKFKVRIRKIKMKMATLERYINSYLTKLENIPEGDPKRVTLVKKLESATSEMEYLKTKLDSDINQ